MKLQLIFWSSILLIGFNSCKTNSSNNEPLSDFAFKDTASISKVRISDTENNEITISREKNDQQWRINNSEYLANTFNINLILETFYRTIVKQDIPKDGVEHSLTMLSVRHKKVEIFINDEKEPIKTWYVGSSTKDHLGTFMLLQNKKQKSSIPYITYKPGFYGTLDVRFFTNWKDWRSHLVFSYPNSKKIKSINTIFNDFSEESYIIKNKNNAVSLFSNNNKQIDTFDSIQVKHYLTHFNNINYNQIEFKDSSYKDSIFNLTPHIEFKLSDDNSKMSHIKLWRIKSDFSETGWDKEYGFIKINDSYELLKVQFFNWDILFKPLSYFTK